MIWREEGKKRRAGREGGKRSLNTWILGRSRRISRKPEANGSPEGRGRVSITNQKQSPAVVARCCVLYVVFQPIMVYVVSSRWLA